MGEVYRARDLKLGRDVALKILPDIFVGDPDSVARFEREAQVVASLNHPNIAIIHGFQESDGVKALVLELVEGESLSSVIARGPFDRRTDVWSFGCVLSNVAMWRKPSHGCRRSGRTCESY
jgi:serine/threonine protein kinase